MVLPSDATQQVLRSDQRRKIPRSAITPAGNRALKPPPNITFANTSPNIRIGKTPTNTRSGNSLQFESGYFSPNTRSDIPLTRRSLSICSEDVSPTRRSLSICSEDISPTRRSLSICSEDISPTRRSLSILSVDVPSTRRFTSIRSVDIPPTGRSPSIQSEDILSYRSSPSIRSGDIAPIRTSPNTLPIHRSLRTPTHTISLRSPNSKTTLENIPANTPVLADMFGTLPLQVNSPTPQSKSLKDQESKGQREMSANTPPNRRSAFTFPNVESSSTSRDASTDNILLSLLSQKALKLNNPLATKNSSNKWEDIEQNSSGTERNSPSANSVRYISPILVQRGKS